MGNVKGWHYYKHAILPDVAPHIEVDTDIIDSGEAWNLVDKSTLLARWTSEYDCGHETDWWYLIKDEPFDLSSLKAKRRYEINKGNKYFYVDKIDPSAYLDGIYSILVEAYANYPAKYRPEVDKKIWETTVSQEWCDRKFCVFGAFHRETHELCGFAVLEHGKEVVHFSNLKVKPSFEKFAINAAIVFYVLTSFNVELRNGIYVCDGERNIQHETAFQDYLEKYFGFRKAYCKLNLAYNPKIKWLIGLIYPFRGLLKKCDNIGIVHKVNGVLTMEEIVRKQKKADKKDAK